MRRGLTALAASVATLIVLPAAGTAGPVTSVLAGQTVSGSAIPCTALSDGVRVCHGTDGGLGGTDLRFKGVGGTPLEVYVILPPAPSSATDGPYPLIAQNHGYGNQAAGPEQDKTFVSGEYLGPTADVLARQGIATVQLTARGFGDSCGKSQSLAMNPPALAACGTSGYVRLDDNRYEARDVQSVIGQLVDEGIADPGKLGTTGESYGGGISMQLATLKDRVMDPDGSLHPWTSPKGTPLSFAAAAPVIPWSDLVYSLLPNGRTLDFGVTPPSADLTPVGIEKQSFVAGLYALGQAKGNYCAPSGSPSCSDADLTRWFADIGAGEPYDSNPDVPGIVDQIARYHSAYYLLDGKYGYPQEQPPPLFIANGFTDDLFPVDEALRYLNLEHSLFPSAPSYLYAWDGGHARGQNKKADNLLLAQEILTFFQHYLQSASATPAPVTALTLTCPSSAPTVTYQANSWGDLHPGEVDYTTTKAQTISSGGGDPSVAKAFDPIAGGGACATAPSTAESGVATYQLPAVTAGGYTLLGSATVGLSLTTTGQYPEIAARLLDVDPKAGTETLVARGLYRPTADGQQYFQLHPGAWHFAAGHIPELQLLGRDAPYARASNGQFSIAVSALALRLPVHETPLASGGGGGGGGSAGGGGAGGTPPAVHPAQPGLPKIPTTHPASRCLAPSVRIRRVRTRGHTVRLNGTTGTGRCAHASASQRRRASVRVVYVTVSDARRGCASRSARTRHRLHCARTRRWRAHGTRRWSLRLRLTRGYYRVKVQAVDGYGHRSRVRSRTLRIRR